MATGAGLARWKSGTKYNAKKTVVDGIAFDSKKEAARWRELSLMEGAGEIRNLRRQVGFELLPEIRGPDTTGPGGGVKKGKLIQRAVRYMADFVYEDADGRTVVEDSKGFRTPEYRLKRKMMLALKGIEVLET